MAGPEIQSVAKGFFELHPRKPWDRYSLLLCDPQFIDRLETEQTFDYGVWCWKFKYSICYSHLDITFNIVTKTGGPKGKFIYLIIEYIVHIHTNTLDTYEHKWTKNVKQELWTNPGTLMNSIKCAWDSSGFLLLFIRFLEWTMRGSCSGVFSQSSGTVRQRSSLNLLSKQLFLIPEIL